MTIPGEDQGKITRNSSGIWTLEGDRLASVEDFDEGPSVVLVHSEHVLILAVELPPITSLAKRRAALPFAIEERVAEPLDQVHVALGEEIAPNIYLAGVVRHDLMRQWVARLEYASLDYASLVPDALALPRPRPGSWAVDLAADRVSVRAADGTGFAMPFHLLEQAWVAAGEPNCIAYGDPLPPQMHAPTLELPDQPLAQRLIVPALDLRQGLYAAPRRRVSTLWKRVAAVAAVGALAHAAIAGAETLALRDIADEREAAVRSLAQNMQPPFSLGPDLAITIADVTPDGPVSAPSQFIPLLARAGSALAALSSPVTWRSVGFDSAAQTLSIEIGAADLNGLRAASAALEASGLAVTPGAASNAQGAGSSGTIGSFAVRVQ